ncbi:hypothetical protein RCL1_008585 [Eukaryota sp. TZLM3-RCL]
MDHCPELAEASEASRLHQQALETLDDDDFMPMSLVANPKASSISKPSFDNVSVISTKKEKVPDSEAKELHQSLSSLQAFLTSAKNKVTNVLALAQDLQNTPEFLSLDQDDKSSLEKGISLLSAKANLLSNYCLNCAFYMLLKIRDEPVKNHPVLKHLVTIRLYLEKTRDLEERVRHVINRILSAQKTCQDQSNLTDLRPNLSSMIESDSEIESRDDCRPDTDDDDSEDDSVGTYKPPKVSGLELMDAEKEELLSRKKKDRLHKSRLFNDLRADLTDAPEEISGSITGVDIKTMMSHDKLEEERMTRVHRKTTKKTSDLGVSFTGNDDVLSMLAEESNLIDGAGSKRRSFSQVVGAASSKKKRVLSDSEDEVDENLTQNIAENEDMDGEILDENFEKEELSDIEDDMNTYHQRKKHRDYTPQMDQESEGKRKTNWTIDRNKGLTKHHSKASKHSRVKYREQYDKNKKKNEGGRKRTQGSSGRYDGESGSIKKGVSRSRRF